MQATQFADSTLPLRQRVFTIKTHSNYSLFGLFLVVDQLLLPMFHISSISFKLSYVSIGIWFLHWLLQKKRRNDVQRDIESTFLTFASIITCIFLGELWLVSMYPVNEYGDIVRVVITYILVGLAFSLGRSVKHFELKWLIKILFVALFLNFSFIFFKNDLPTWLINFYYPERTLGQNWDDLGITSINDLIELARPRGLFGNPNASMLMVNIIILFIHLGLRHRLLEIRLHLVAVILIVCPLILAGMLGSRGEFIVTITLGLLNYQIFRRTLGRRFRQFFTRLSLVTVLLVGLAGTQLEGEIPTLESLNRIAMILAKTDGEDTDSSIARPLNQVELAWQRFSSSPLFGAGISAALAPGFDEGTQHFHNDWLMLLATTGIIGSAVLFRFLVKFAWPIGWPILIPFVLPGLVNTFSLNIPVFIFYFFMIGIFRSKLRDRMELS